MERELGKEERRIADAIVALVEAANGYVTLARVQREIPGFAADRNPSWSYEIEHSSGTIRYWSGMTSAGLDALRSVMRERRVAIQFVTPIPYLLEGTHLRDDDWRPIVLLPTEAANLDGPKGLVRFAPKRVPVALEFPGWRELTPQVGSTADVFAM